MGVTGMNINKILINVALVAVIIALIVGYAYNHQEVAYDPFENNTAAKEIRDLGIEVAYEDLGTDGNGYTVRGQAQFLVDENNVWTPVKVVLDDDIDPNSYDAHAILYHELGHIVTNGGTEEQADNYAHERGYEIVDAYHGIH